MGSVQPYGNRFRIVIYWKGKHRRLSCDCDAFRPFYTRREAQKYLGVAQQQIDRGEFDPANWKADSPVLVERKALEWLKSKKVGKKCLQGYATAVKKYIIPMIGRKDVRKLKAGELQDLYDNLLDISNEIGYKVMSTLRTMLHDLYRREDIFRVPPFPILTRSSEKKVVEYLTIDQQDKLVDAIPERHRPIFEFGMEFGLRTQEVRAIQWDCVKDGKLIIRRAFSENEIKGTKTGDEREYRLTRTGQAIIEYAKRQTSTTFVFIREDGRSYTNKDINRIWKMRQNMINKINRIGSRDEGSTPAAATKKPNNSSTYTSETRTSFVPNSHCLSISAACLLISVAGFLLMGCAGGAVRPERIPLQDTVVFEIEKVTVVCSGEDAVKRAWVSAGGLATVDTKSVYAFTNRASNTIYIPCVRINGLILPDNVWVIGHEFLHIIGFKYLNAMNPDWKEAR